MQLYFLLRSLVPGQQIQIESGNYRSWGYYLAKIKTVDKTIHHKNSFISSMASFKTNWRKKWKVTFLRTIYFLNKIYSRLPGRKLKFQEMWYETYCQLFVPVLVCEHVLLHIFKGKISYFTSREAKCLVVSDVSAWITSEYEVFSGNRLGPLKTLGLFYLPLFCSCRSSPTPHEVFFTEKIKIPLLDNSHAMNLKDKYFLL